VNQPADARDPRKARTAPPHRLFFALWPDDAVRGAIAQAASLLVATEAGRATDPQRYHLTVAYLGDFQPLPETVLSAAMAAGASIHMDPFEVSLDRFGAFAGSHVRWLGPGVIPAGLLALHEGLMEALLSSRLPTRTESAFAPHVTIRRRVRAPAPAPSPPVVRWPVHDFVLIDSQPGMDYRIVARWPLRTA
jgi:2'-5' RNA ligase